MSFPKYKNAIISEAWKTLTYQNINFKYALN